MVMPSREEADPMIVLGVVRNPTCMAICPCTEENQQKLEDLMPLVEIPKGKNIVSDIYSMEPLTNDQRNQIGELFEDIDIAYEHLAHLCNSLGILSRTLKPCQLLLLLRASIRPLVQLNITPGLFKEPELGQQRMELPEENTGR